MISVLRKEKIMLPVMLMLSLLASWDQAGAEEILGNNNASNVYRNLSVASQYPNPVRVEHPGVSEDLENRASRAGYAYRVNIVQTRRLDPAIFTMIRPFTLDQSPVKLPKDQVLE